MTPMRAGAAALLLTAGTGLAISGAMGSVSAASKPAPAPAPVAAPVSPAQSFVDRAYADILNRPADLAGEAYWVGQVNAGVSHTKIAATFAQTDQYRNVI